MKGPTARVSADVPKDDARRLAWLARKRRVPLAAVLRDAVYAYVLPIATDADAARRRRRKASR